MLVYYIIYSSSHYNIAKRYDGRSYTEVLGGMTPRPMIKDRGKILFLLLFSDLTIDVMS